MVEPSTAVNGNVMIRETEIGVRRCRGEVSLDEDGASVSRDDEEVGEEVGELADGRTIRSFSWVTPGDERAEET